MQFVEHLRIARVDQQPGGSTVRGFVAFESVGAESPAEQDAVARGRVEVRREAIVALGESIGQVAQRCQAGCLPGTYGDAVGRPRAFGTHAN